MKLWYSANRRNITLCLYSRPNAIILVAAKGVVRMVTCLAVPVSYVLSQLNCWAFLKAFFFFFLDFAQCVLNTPGEWWKVYVEEATLQWSMSIRSMFFFSLPHPPFRKMSFKNVLSWHGQKTFTFFFFHFFFFFHLTKYSEGSVRVEQQVVWNVPAFLLFMNLGSDGKY